MSGNFFDRLEIELADMVRDGRHLTPTQQHDRRRTLLIKRGLIIAALIVALAASLASEFPASANGRTDVAQIALVSGA